MKRFIPFFIALFMAMVIPASSQEQGKPDWRKLHYLSEEEMNMSFRDMLFTETPPPTGEVRFPGEFEPMQAVMIRYPLGIPLSAVVELANDIQVITVVSSSYQSQAMSTYQNAGVNMDNCVFVNINTDSYWIRDYGPWYIFNDTDPAIVDFPYDRPRPNDNLVPVGFANYWNVPLYGMNLYQTGGNMMEDGRGVGASDDLVYDDNPGMTEEQVREKMRSYLGIDPYHITIDPMGDYIKHIDCFAKFLAPDKILITRVPQSDPRYNDYESVANYFATTNCSWGYPYKVYRVDVPGGNTVAPYTNSLIVNNKVLVPIGTNSTYNENALQVYREALPGYNIVGIPNNDYSIGWLNSDAMHCRSRGVMDFDMLYIDHRDVVFGEQEWQDSIAITSKIIAYSEQPLVSDSLLVYYSIDGGEYQTAKMSATGDNEYTAYIKGYSSLSEVDYYVFAKDESGRRYTQPVFGPLEPHHFTMEEVEPQGFACYPPILTFVDSMEASGYIVNYSYDLVPVLAFEEVGTNYLTIEPEIPLPYTLAAYETLNVFFSVNTLAKDGEQVETDVNIIGNDGVLGAWHVVIDEHVLSVEAVDVNNSIYPNPASVSFAVSRDAQSLVVYNLVGQKVCELFDVKRDDVVSVEGWHPGVYVVAMRMNDGSVKTEKLVVK